MESHLNEIWTGLFQESTIISIYFNRIISISEHLMIKSKEEEYWSIDQLGTPFPFYHHTLGAHPAHHSYSLIQRYSHTWSCSIRWNIITRNAQFHIDRPLNLTFMAFQRQAFKLDLHDFPFPEGIDGFPLSGLHTWPKRMAFHYQRGLMAFHYKAFMPLYLF